MRVYLDHGVYSRLNDHSPNSEHLEEACLEIFEAAKNGEIILIISEANWNEIDTSPEEVQEEIGEKLHSIPKENIELIQDTEEILSLRNTYLEENVLGGKSIDDAHHIAAATVHKADLIISLDKDDIDNQGRVDGLWEGKDAPKKGFNIVNEEQGYQKIKVCAPQHFRDHYEEYQREKGREEGKRVEAIAHDLKTCRNEKEFQKRLEERGYVLSKSETDHVVLVDFEGKSFDLTEGIEKDPLLQKSGKYLSIETKPLPSVEEAKEKQEERIKTEELLVKREVEFWIEKEKMYQKSEIDNLVSQQCKPEEISKTIERHKTELDIAQKNEQNAARIKLQKNQQQKLTRLVSLGLERVFGRDRGLFLGKF